MLTKRGSDRAIPEIQSTMKPRHAALLTVALILLALIVLRLWLIAVQ